MSNCSNRLQDKVAVITGGAGEIGMVVAQRYLEEGARVILTGRTEEKLRAATGTLLALDLPELAKRVDFAVIDSSSPGELAHAASEISRKWGDVHVLVNNAGTAGPKYPLGRIPLTPADLEKLNAPGGTETLIDAVGSLLGGPWHTTRAFIPFLAADASVINVSTIFSRTDYYGRIAYVAPKAALNALSCRMADELGRDSRRVRVNTVLPGPVDGDRIRTVFAAMDELKQVPRGTTNHDIARSMVLGPAESGSTYVPKREIADVIVFLGSHESRSIAGQEFEVARGLRHSLDEAASIVPSLRFPRGSLVGRLIWVIGDDQVEGACRIAELHRDAGARVILTFRKDDACERGCGPLRDGSNILIRRLDPFASEDWATLEHLSLGLNCSAFSAIVLPWRGVDGSGSPLQVPDSQVQEFLMHGVASNIAIARGIERFMAGEGRTLGSLPTVIFTSDGGNPASAFSDVRRAGIRQLLRVWRHECLQQSHGGVRRSVPRVHQVVRTGGRPYMDAEALFNIHLMICRGCSFSGAIDLILDSADPSEPSQTPVTGDRAQSGLPGHTLHLDKVVLVTGGSEGIGGQITLQMALAGAKVVIAERSSEKLERVYHRIVEDIRSAGFAEPEKQVLLIPNCDVTREQDLAGVVARAVAHFGRLDFLVNNAGLTGGEMMTVDLPVDLWEMTLKGNLISNYHLILRALPEMKDRGGGHILNMGSYFGSARNGDVAYPNRSDYAVSKAGQLAIVEALAPFLGPDVQINGLAPGPVDGARLNGTGGRPGLYARRARLIAESRRLGEIHSLCVREIREGMDPARVLGCVARNRLDAISGDEMAPESLRQVATAFCRDGRLEGGSSRDFLLNALLAERLVDRLARAHLLPPGFLRREFLKTIISPPDPFISAREVETGARKIRDRIMPHLALQRMPTDSALAIEVVSTLAHRTMTGEVMFPTCGFRYEGQALGGSFRHDGETYGSQLGTPDQGLVSALNDQIILLLGDSMPEEMAELAGAYLQRSARGVRKVVVATASEIGAQAVKANLRKLGETDAIEVLAFPGKMSDEILESCLASYGMPQVVVSFPLGPISFQESPSLPKWRCLPEIHEFNEMIAQHLTTHFRVARIASLIDGCRIIFVTSRIHADGKSISQAMGRFVSRTLRPLTLAAGREAAHLCSAPLFHQLDGSMELARFIDTALLMSLPKARQSEHRERSKAS